MELTEIIVEKSLLDGFKRRCYKQLPNEHLEVLRGTIDEAGVATVTGLMKVPYRATPEEVETEFYDSPEDEIGTLHSHPDGAGSPSDEDINELKGSIIGICAISQRGKRKYTSFSFWQVSASPIDLTIVEDEEDDSEERQRVLREEREQGQGRQAEEPGRAVQQPGSGGEETQAGGVF